MDVIGHLANALAGLPAILGIARGYVAALVVVAEALSHWMGAIVMAVAAFALVSSEAHGQTHIDEVTLQATASIKGHFTIDQHMPDGVTLIEHIGGTVPGIRFTLN